MSEIEKLEALLKHVADIAHNGGLLGLEEGDAMHLIRRLTMGYWDARRGREEERRGLEDALQAAELETRKKC